MELFPDISPVVPVLLVLAANLLRQNGKAFVTKEVSCQPTELAGQLRQVIQTVLIVGFPSSSKLYEPRSLLPSQHQRALQAGFQPNAEEGA